MVAYSADHYCFQNQTLLPNSNCSMITPPRELGYLFSIVKIVLVSTFLSLFAISCQPEPKKLLVFSKTEGFRHKSIEPAIEALKILGQENGYTVKATEDADHFVEDSLKSYSAIIFLNTTQDILNDVQQADFERYIQSGGGFVGIHAATDTEYDWPWYNKLVGAVFNGHPKIQEAQLQIVTKDHPATNMFEDSIWSKSDEWYNFKKINPDINVLIRIDESSYEGGTNGDNHPISWYHNYDGGRSFYTELGHTDETYENPTFLKHLLGGISYAVGENKRDYAKAKTQRVPPEDRFVKNILDFNLNEPMELDELPDEGIIFIERRGAVKFYDFNTEGTQIMGEIPVWYGNEDGLLGVAVDPNYAKNNWVYMFYTADSDESIQHISRFTVANKKN